MTGSIIIHQNTNCTHCKHVMQLFQHDHLSVQTEDSILYSKIQAAKHTWMHQNQTAKIFLNDAVSYVIRLPILGKHTGPSVQHV